MTETSAEVVSSTGQVIKTAQVVGGDNASGYSVLVEIAGLKPSEAATIRVSGSFDGKSLILVASLKEFATTCSQDLNLFVDTNAPAKNRSCAATEKCQTITKALEVLPDIINCKVTIDVARGLYQESIRIEDKVMRSGGLLTIQGAPPENLDPYPTVLSNDISHPDLNSKKRNFVIVGLANGGNPSINVFKLKSLELKKDPATETNGSWSYGFVSHSSNFGLEHVKLSDYDFGVFTPTASAVRLKNLEVENVKIGFFARNPTAVLFAGKISIIGTDRSDPNSIGVQLDSPNLLSIGQPINLLESLEIKNFYQGMRLNGAVANFKGGEKLAIQDVHHGISMFESSGLQLPDLAVADTNPVDISIRNFTGTGILLSKSSIKDGETTNSRPTALPTSQSLKSHSLKLEGSPDAFMMWATDNGVIDLSHTTFNFCFKSFLSSPHTETPDGWSNSIYALAVDSGAEARFWWASNPFTTGESCSSPISPQKLHAKTYKYRFAATLSGGAKFCPAGYVLQSDDFCYGALGITRYTKPTSTVETFFGVLEGDSRIDHLP